MLTLSNIKVLHLEPTDVCQLACPLCARETDVEFNSDSKNHLTIQQIQQHFTDDDIKNLDKMFMCGNYGEPAAGRHTLEIFQWFRQTNSSAVLGMNTNGSLQTQTWWQQLAKILNQEQDYVVFSIDGLEDTNQIYRVGVNWQKLMENAQAFINAGGSAHWDMLVYRHNQHQVDDCIDLAKRLGFKWFRAKVSKRPLVNNLEYPINWAVPILGSKINCHALHEQSVYLDAQNRLSPCCWLGSRQSNFISTIQQVSVTWESDQIHPVCASTCSANDKQTAFSQQWQIELQL